MEWMDLLNQIANICLVPILGALAAYCVKWINVKADEITNKIDNDTADKYVQMLAQTITDCVMATKQTYVEALKKDNLFDAEAQKEAFRITFEAVMDVLAEDAKDYLTNLYGDLEAYIKTKIEAEVNLHK